MYDVLLSLSAFLVEFLSMDCGAIVTIGGDMCTDAIGMVDAVDDDADDGGGGGGGSETGRNVGGVTFGDNGPYE